MNVVRYGRTDNRAHFGGIGGWQSLESALRDTRKNLGGQQHLDVDSKEEQEDHRGDVANAQIMVRRYPRCSETKPFTSRPMISPQRAPLESPDARPPGQPVCRIGIAPQTSS